MSCPEIFLQKVREYSWTIPPLFDALLSSFTTTKAGGPAQLLMRVCNSAELSLLLQWIDEYKTPWLVLGKGSNTLFTDNGFDGVVFLLARELAEIEISKEPNSLIAGAGASDVKLANTARENGLAGAEFLATIPGNIGGAIFMNAGAHGGEIAQILDWVEYLTPEGEKIYAKKEELSMDYRFSSFMKLRAVITRAGFCFPKGNPEEIKTKEKELLRYRRQNQPVHVPTWGSVFVNPPNQSSGKLIEQCGLKGKGFGAARISPMHANFIENTGGASFEDIKKTILLARDTVFSTFGIRMHLEVRIINPDGSPHLGMKI